MRRSAKLLKVSYSTVVKRTRYLAGHCRKELGKQYAEMTNIRFIQFDELQTIEHTKCKPLANAVAVNSETREILGFEVSSMPATGHLSKISRQKYDYRPDHRREGVLKLLRKMKPMMHAHVQILSDFCPFYASAVKEVFPQASHHQVLGEKACVAGQGELKKVGKDPLFYINHTLAMLRANINRLIRRTWSTTKDPVRLMDHLAIYTYYHNRFIIQKEA